MKHKHSNNKVVIAILVAIAVIAGVAFWQSTQPSNEVPGGVIHSAGTMQGNNGGE